MNKQLILGGLILAFALGYTARKYAALTLRDTPKHSCPLPVSVRALQGCELSNRTAIHDKEEIRRDLWLCENRVASLESTINCMLDPTDCRSRGEDE